MGSHIETPGGCLITRGLLLLLLEILLTCCNFSVPLSPSLDLSETKSQLPFTVGAYYSPEFQEYEAVELVGFHGESEFIRPLGQASISIFDKALSVIFDKVVHLASWPPLKEIGANVAIVIEPRIEAHDFGPPNRGVGWGPAVWAEITYGIRIYSPKGDEIGVWKVHGMGETETQSFRELQVLGRATDQAIQDAITKFVTGFREVPEVKRWLRDFGMQSSGMQ